MKDNAAVYSQILEWEDSVIQDNVLSRRAALQRILKVADEYIDTLPISEEQKEALRSLMGCPSLLAKDCLKRIEDLHHIDSKFMMLWFSRLSPREQEEAISVYLENEQFAIPENNLVVIQGGKHP